MEDREIPSAPRSYQPDPSLRDSSPSWWQVLRRFIASLGLLNTFLGFVYCFLYAAFAGTVNLADMKSATCYLFRGAVMSAPIWPINCNAPLSSFGAAAQAGVHLVQPAASPVPVRGSAVG